MPATRQVTSINPDAILAKTNKGREEMATRQHELSPSLRFALILVDGRSPLARLLVRGAGLPNLDEALEMLVQMGFVEVAGERSWGGAGAEPDPADPAAAPSTSADPAREKLVALAEQLFGARADKLVKKIREAEGTPSGLNAAVESCHKIIKLVIDERKADEFLVGARSILNRQ
jgi:hypothetical protein